MKKILSLLFLILLYASHILFSSTVTEARPLPRIFEDNNWRNDWLINLEISADKFLRPSARPPPPPKSNPPKGPGLSIMDDVLITSKFSEDFMTNQHIASA